MSLRSTLQKYLPLKVSPLHLTFFAVQIIYFIRLLATDQFRLALENVALLLYSFVTLAALVQLLNTLTSWSRALRVGLNLLLFVLYNFLFAYHLNVKSSLDVSVIIDNAGVVLAPETLGVAFSALDLPSVLFTLAALPLLLVAEWRLRLLSGAAQRPPLLPKATAALLVYGVILVAPLTTYDEPTYFLQSLHGYYLGADRVGVEIPPGRYPLVRRGFAHGGPAAGAERPNIFLITLESLNANVIERECATGRPCTPVFNRLVGQGLYVERFYGNSIQTCKGLTAILFSVVPAVQGKLFTTYSDTRLQSIPEILRGRGYDTLFVQAYEDLAFDGTGAFLGKNGFAAVKSIYELLKPEDQPYVWGFGPEDKVFYRRLFDLLDRRREETGPKPVFVTAVTTNNHMRFDDVPPDRRAFFREPRSLAEAYANSVHLADSQLGELFDQLQKRPHLRNSIVILVGDHSFPLGEHGIVHNEAGFYEESFRVPLLIVWPGKIAPLRVRRTAYSQLDIAPTLLALLGLTNLEHHFVGLPIVGERPEQHPIYLVQPYSGRYLGVVRWPYKYLYHQRTRGESVFNLTDDPDESENVADRLPSGQLEQLRQDLRFVFLNQRAIERNAVWPR